MRRNKFLNITLICLGVLLAAGAAFSGGPALAFPAGGQNYVQEQPPGDPERGGQLYTAWDLVVGRPEVADKQPYWPLITSNQVPDRLTWRCVNCHGWDYRGSDGPAISGPQRIEDYPGLLSYNSDPVETILPWLDGTNDPNHDFSGYLTPQDMQDLSAFLASGLIAPNLIAPAGSKAVQGTLNVGENMYADYCQSCHGVEGEKINFGSTANPSFMGDLSWANPWRIAHIIRYGHVSTAMPAASRLDLSFSQQIDLLAYLQTLPRATNITAAGDQLIDYSTQASTIPMLIGAVAIGILVFTTVAVTTRRRKQT